MKSITKTAKILGILIVVIMASYSCSVTRNVPQGRYLLKKNVVQLDTDKKLSDKGELKEQLTSIILQKQNTRILGIPYKLYLYNLFYPRGVSDSTKIQRAKSLVQMPVILDTNLVHKSKENMKYHLLNSGYFNAAINDSILYKENRQAIVYYNINTGNPYIITKKNKDIHNEQWLQLIDETESQSLLKVGEPYSNTKAGEERIRITNTIRNKGYFNFNAEQVSFLLDTNKVAQDNISSSNLAGSIIELFLNNQAGSNKVAITTKIKSSEDSMLSDIYRIRNVSVITNFYDTTNLLRLTAQQTPFTIEVYNQSNRYIQDDILISKIAIRPTNLYSITDYDNTIKRLNELGTFQFVRVRYVPTSDTFGNKLLNVFILLGANAKYDFNTNVEISGGDIYAFGTAANVSLLNKNLFGGANQLNTTLSYGLELGRDEQRSDIYRKQFYLFSQNLGLNFSLLVPKFLVPFALKTPTYNNYPRTIFNFGLNNLYRSNFFLNTNINASMQYQWRETPLKTWNVKPLYFNQLILSRVSPSFQERMDSIPAIKNAYQQTFILGHGVEYVYNTSLLNPTNNTFIKVGIEEAGGIMSGIDAIFNTNIKFARFVRLDFDGRRFIPFRLGSIAMRFYGGIGIPYGPSATLPYIKQYFAGGAYSIRGWRPRTIGPGGYYDINRNRDGLNLFIDQAGDIKLESNVEYRFPMFKLFANAIKINGAVFADAGNIWLAREEPNLPNAAFKIKNIFNDLAISSGLGLRLDLGGFLVFRVDYAIQLKEPYATSAYNGWLVPKMQLGNAGWRSSHSNLSVAIGYPF